MAKKRTRNRRLQSDADRLASQIAKRPPKNNRKIQDLERFKQFVRQHQDKTQQQIAEKWGENVTQQNEARWN